MAKSLEKTVTKNTDPASVGILMLESRFPRILGDIGNPQTWPFTVHYKWVKNATPNRVVRDDAETLFENFLTAAQELVAQGANGITTSCGFLTLFQDRLSDALNVPVATSSLMQLPMVDRLLPPGTRAGILTISPATLSQQHLLSAGCALDTPVGGTAINSEFTTAILNDEVEFDVELARAENIAAALELQKANPGLGALVLECTNMVPYAADIHAATGLPVYSIYSFIMWFQAGLQPKIFRD